MTYGSFLYPPQIHLEQEDPLNLDEENNARCIKDAFSIIQKYIIVGMPSFHL